MIITMTDIIVRELLLISSKDAPRIIFFEFVTANNNMGITTGNPRIAIIVEALLVLDEMDEIIVKLNPIPSDPMDKLT